MALGLNMPVKTVVFIEKEDEPLISAEFVQASGRAGRWGLDKTGGGIIFLNYKPHQIAHTMWSTIDSVVTKKTPLSLHVLLMISSGFKGIRKNIVDHWFNLNIPQWNWNNKDKIEKNSSSLVLDNQTLFFKGINTLRDLKLISDDYKITKWGTLALSLIDEGPISLIVGCIFSIFREQIYGSILSKVDFLCLVSHFLLPWRATCDGPTLTEIDLGISEEMKKLLTMMNRFCTVELGLPAIMNMRVTTALYVMFPNLKSFPLIPISEADSFASHFYCKMKFFQQFAKLPFGDEALEAINVYLSK
jgi:hypothetical protein